MPPNSVLSMRLDLGVVELGQDALGPGGELDLELQRRAVAGEAIGVAQAGVDLVQDVPGRPEAVQVEAAGADVAARHLGEALAAALASAPR